MKSCTISSDDAEHHRRRSDFIRGLVQRADTGQAPCEKRQHPPPKAIVQYWHDVKNCPADVQECMSSWSRWTADGFSYRVFDEACAREFIENNLGPRHRGAFDRCYHPAMQSDYFRLCYLRAEGGFYVDADDVCIATRLDILFEDGRLRVQPLCYDIDSAAMVNTGVFLPFESYQPNWIFYVNNNPLICGKGHPIIELALERATLLLECHNSRTLPEIQETTGPGNLSRAIFKFGMVSDEVERELVVLREWESFALSKWPLSYREDARNWRLSNQKRLHL